MAGERTADEVRRKALKLRRMAAWAFLTAGDGGVQSKKLCAEATRLEAELAQMEPSDDRA